MKDECVERRRRLAQLVRRIEDELQVVWGAQMSNGTCISYLYMPQTSSTLAPRLQIADHANMPARGMRCTGSQAWCRVSWLATFEGIAGSLSFASATPCHRLVWKPVSSLFLRTFTSPRFRLPASEELGCLQLPHRRTDQGAQKAENKAAKILAARQGAWESVPDPGLQSRLKMGGYLQPGS